MMPSVDLAGFVEWIWSVTHDEKPALTKRVVAARIKADKALPRKPEQRRGRPSLTPTSRTDWDRRAQLQHPTTRSMATAT